MYKRVFGISILTIALLLTTPVSSWGGPDDNVYLETIGGLCGPFMYMTYAYIGVAADAYSKNIYKNSQVKLMIA